ncbi:MAG: DMP19 family protein [Planctomycetaceae bacterium]
MTNPLSVVMLLIDYETECSINGIIGFLGNEAGSRLPETISAFRAIGLGEHADTLESIQSMATSAGMTYDALQADRVGLEPFAVTSFEKLHGNKWDDACDSIQAMYANVDWDSCWPAAIGFIERNVDSINGQLQGYQVP